MIAQRLKQVNSTARELYLNETAAVFFFLKESVLCSKQFGKQFISHLLESHTYINILKTKKPYS